jgi:DNA-binding MarR family transcriptional regulator
LDIDERHIGRLLLIPYRLFLKQLHEELAVAGYPDIHPAHGNNVFQHLPDEGARITELAERAQLTKQSMGYLVNHLETQGYVERVPDPMDGRAKLVMLTERGRAVTPIAEGIIRRIEADWTCRFGEQEMRELRSLLARLIASLTEPDGE